MGIDIYMGWNDITDEEKRGQITGFEVSADAGGAGYLREAYHGGPYVTEYLVAEAFDDDVPMGESDPARIADLLAELRSKPELIAELGERALRISPEPDSRVYNTTIVTERGYEKTIAIFPAAVLRERLETAKEIARIRYLGVYKTADASEMTGALEGFVELAEYIEASGRGPVSVYASY